MKFVREKENIHIMKKIAAILLVGCALTLSAFGQKYAFVDTDYILNNIPRYKSAQTELDALSKKYEDEIKTQYEAIDKLWRDYQGEKVLLSEEVRMQREEDIIEKEREAKKLQNDYFGQEGLLFKKREQLVKPIQDEVYNAVKEIANENGYAVIFDSSSGPTMLYTNPRYDVSDEVLKRLGYKN
jgi:outer membrane protein